MVKRTEDKRLKNKVKDDESILNDPILPDKNNGHPDSVAAINTMDNIVPLLEEEPEKRGSETDKEDMYEVLEPEQLPDPDTPGVHAEKLGSLKDFLMEEDQQGVPSDIHNVIDDMPEQQESSKNNLHNDSMDVENISKSANIIDSQSIPPETHALRDEPEMTATDDAPGIMPLEESATTTLPQLRPVPVMLFAFIGMAGLATLLWINSTLSGRIDQLESQLSVAQKKIISINRHMHELDTVVSSHQIAVAKTVQPAARQIPGVILPNPSLPPLR